MIDSSTIDPAVSKEMAVAAEKMGAVFMDAPVSGGNGPPTFFNLISSSPSLQILWFAIVPNIPYSIQWLLFIVLNTKAEAVSQEMASFIQRK